jgi:hypothetical protein
MLQQRHRFSSFPPQCPVHYPIFPQWWAGKSITATTLGVCALAVILVVFGPFPMSVPVPELLPRGI